MMTRMLRPAGARAPGLLRKVAAPVLLLMLSGCQSLPAMPDSVHWYRNSAEKRALYEQTFQAAGRELRARAQGLPRGSWAVIMDVDETVLDNSDYVVEFGHYTAPTWDQWTARKSASALPGAARFVAQVRELGGVAAFVTNREEKACDDTRENLTRAGIPHDIVLCMQQTGDKNPRFAAIESGSAGLPPLKVLMWLGDNIEDFPRQSQTDVEIAAFGTRYFVFPNPYYGSWESQPRR